jgi:hypothetical protein
MATTYADTRRAACELASGLQAPSVKVALFAAILSAQESLERNAREMAVLRERGWLRALPHEHEQVYQAMHGIGFFTRSKCAGLYWAEMLDKAGLLTGLDDIGATWEQQNDWRNKVYHLMHGHGMAWKTISFAALILAPLTCELVPVDRHVLARFGLPNNAGCKSHTRYLGIERMVRDERDLAGYHSMPLGLWHWLKWEQWRQQTGASTETNECQSHAALSCRNY